MVRLLLIITGASRGLGACIAKAFCEQVAVAPPRKPGVKRQRSDELEEDEEVITFISVRLVARSEEDMNALREEIEVSLLQKQQERFVQEASSTSTNKVSNVDIDVTPVDLSDPDALGKEISNILDNEEERHREIFAPYERIVLINNHGTLGHLGPALSSTNTFQSMQEAINLNVTASLWISVLVTQFIIAQERFLEPYDDPETPPFEGTIVNISSLAAVQPFPTMAVYAAGKAVRMQQRSIYLIVGLT